VVPLMGHPLPEVRGSRLGAEAQKMKALAEQLRIEAQRRADNINDMPLGEDLTSAARRVLREIDRCTAIRELAVTRSLTECLSRSGKRRNVTRAALASARSLIELLETDAAVGTPLKPYRYMAIVQWLESHGALSRLSVAPPAERPLPNALRKMTVVKEEVKVTVSTKTQHQGPNESRVSDTGNPTSQQPSNQDAEPKSGPRVTEPEPEVVEPEQGPQKQEPGMRLFGEGGSVRVDTSRGPGNEWVRLNDLHAASGGGPEKRPSKWLETDGAKRLAAELSTKTGFESYRLVKGGTDPGTWAHWKLGLAYAEWLSPAFHLGVLSDWRRYQEGEAKPGGSADRELIALRSEVRELTAATRLLTQIAEDEREERRKMAAALDEANATVKVVAEEQRQTSAKVACLDGKMNERGDGVHLTASQYRKLLVEKGWCAMKMAHIGRSPSTSSAHGIIQKELKDLLGLKQSTAMKEIPVSKWTDIETYFRRLHTDLLKAEKLMAQRRMFADDTTAAE
jgi:hypothetical protein